MTAWPTIPLREVLIPRLDEVIGDALDEVYVTVRLYGKGATKRRLTNGHSPTIARGFRLHEGDLVYSRIDARNGAFAIVPAKLEGAVVSKDFPCFGVRSDLVEPGLLQRFLSCRLFYTQLGASSHGTTNRQRLSEEALLSHSVPLPPPEDQRRLVAAINEAEEVLRLRSSVAHKAREITSSAFDQILGDPVENPMGWPVVPVSDFVLRFQGGKSIAPTSDDARTQRRVLKVSAVTSGSFRPDECKPVSDTHTPADSHYVRQGDLLMSRANTASLVGATALVDDCPPDLLLPDKLWRFIWRDPANVEPLWALGLFQHPSVRRELSKRATGSSASMKNLAMAKVLTLRVPFPPPAMQERFAVVAGETRQLERLQAASNTRVEQLLDLIVLQAFRGAL